MAASLREQLKISTQALHSELEKVTGLNKPKVDFVTYLNSLKKFYGFYIPLENLFLHTAPLEIQNFYFGGERQKVDLLSKDLLIHGYDKAQISRLHLFDMNSNPPPKKNALWGSVYVVEGATLGGQAISKAMDNQFSHFFNSYGISVGGKWRETIAQIDGLQLGVSQEQEILAGARWTFEKLKDWFLAPES